MGECENGGGSLGFGRVVKEPGRRLCSMGGPEREKRQLDEGRVKEREREGASQVTYESMRRGSCGRCAMLGGRCLFGS